MKLRLLVGSLAAVGAGVGMTHLNSTTLADGTISGLSSGADVAVCNMGATQAFGRVGDIHAYSIQTVSVNLGDETLIWQQNTNMHPVIAQNLYKYHDGRIEMIGMSWLKHGFCALQLSGCGPCPGGGGCPQWLLPGCRDPYSTGLNGQQSNLGPRSEVNASTGFFPYPYQLNWQQSGNAIFKRLQVHDNDLNPALNQGAIYYIEGHYVHQQEGTTELRHNNATYERVNPTPSGNTYNLGFGQNPQLGSPAIYAWIDNDPEVVIEVIDVPGTPVDGRFHLGYRVWDNGDGTWRYEYAVHNLNSHRSAQAFTVPLGDGVEILDTYYRDVPYHSGEPYTNEDWELTIGSDAISWGGELWANNLNANALRWSTMYNFGFVSNSPPTMGEVELTLFRPGSVPSVSAPALIPSDLKVETCPEDLNNDGNVDVFDLLALLGDWGKCPGCDADLNGDGNVDVFDLLQLLGAWGACP